MSELNDRLVAIAYGAGWQVVKRMPERAAYATFDRIADTLWSRRGKDVLRLESNLRRVVGPDVPDEELRRLSKQGMRSYFRYWCDAFRLPGQIACAVLAVVMVGAVVSGRRSFGRWLPS